MTLSSQKGSWSHCTQIASFLLYSPAPQAVIGATILQLSLEPSISPIKMTPTGMPRG